MEKTKNIRSGLWLFVLSIAICAGCAYMGYRSSMIDGFDTAFNYKFGSAVCAVISAYLLLMFMPLPVEQHWIDKVRIGAVLTFGAAVVGVFCWPFIAPHTEQNTVAFYNLSISISDAILVLPAAFATAAAAYFIGWPNGRHTALAAVPMGVGIWGLRSGTMSNLLTYNNEMKELHNVYMSFRWEGIFWFLVIAAGYLGVKAAASACGDTSQWEQEKKKPMPGDMIVPILATCAIAWAVVSLLLQSPKLPTTDSGTLYSQPRQAQAAFALMAGFGVAGYAVKRFINIRYEIPAASTVVFSLAAAIYAGRDSMHTISINMPPTFFMSPICALLPVQTIAFGTLGILIGYSIAVLGNHKKALTDEFEPIA